MELKHTNLSKEIVIAKDFNIVKIEFRNDPTNYFFKEDVLS